MNLLLSTAAFLLLPLTLCSCGAYELASAHSSDEAAVSAVIMIACPPLLVTGVNAMGSHPEERKLPYYARVIRNRNTGKHTVDDNRITDLAMQDAFQLPSLQQMNEEQITALFGPPDRHEKNAQGTVFYYRIQYPDRSHEDVPLFLNQGAWSARANTISPNKRVRPS